MRRGQKQAERIGHLVNRLLDVSQLASGKLKLDLAACGLSDIVKDVADRLSEQASHAVSELRLDARERIKWRLDKFRLEEAISNVCPTPSSTEPGIQRMSS